MLALPQRPDENGAAFAEIIPGRYDVNRNSPQHLLEIIMCYFDSGDDIPGLRRILLARGDNLQLRMPQGLRVQAVYMDMPETGERYF
jgi:hypothetical protein